MPTDTISSTADPAAQYVIRTIIAAQDHGTPAAQAVITEATKAGIPPELLLLALASAIVTLYDDQGLSLAEEGNSLWSALTEEAPND